MSKYIRVIGNYLKISFKKLFKKVNFSGSKVQSFSKFTELNLAKNFNVCFGRNIQSDGFCRIITTADAELSIGSKTFFNNGCTVSCMKKVTIGNNCVISTGCIIKGNVADGSIVTAHIEQHINKSEDK